MVREAAAVGHRGLCVHTRFPLPPLEEISQYKRERQIGHKEHLIAQLLPSEQRALMEISFAPLWVFAGKEGKYILPA